MKIYTFSTDNKGVAPVVGRTLLIVIVIIFAAVIATYIYEEYGDLTEGYVVGTSAQKINSDTICITYLSANRPDLVMYLNVTVNGHHYDNNGTWSITEGNTLGGDGIKPIESGMDIYITDGNITSGSNHVTILARFRDGEQQLVLDTNV